MDHGYRIEGNVNERSLLGIGAGFADPATGVSEVEVRFEQIPAGWDPRTIVLMCCCRSLVMASRESGGAVGMYRASGGYMTIGRHLINGGRESMIRDGDGQVMAHARASSESDYRGDNPHDHSRVEHAVSHLHPGVNGVAHIMPFTGVMMQAGPKLVTLTTSYEVELEDGSTVHGATYYPHYLPEQQVELPSVQLLSVLSVQQEFDGKRLWMRTESEVTPMVVAPALVTT
jgi:hypothetical protein